MEQLSLQNLVDYLHTAVSENDLLFVFYWFKELEGRGEEGKEAIQSGKHSWKNETAMEAIFRSEEKVNETSRIIYAMLKVYEAKLVEEVEMMRDGEGMKERWDMLKTGVEAQAHAALLLSMSEEAAAKWIDECGLAPPAGKVLTGYNTLPQPPTPVLPSPLDEHPSAINVEEIVEPQPRANSHSTDNTSSQSSQNSSPPSSRTSKSTSTSLSSPSYSPTPSLSLQPIPLDSSLIDSDLTNLVRFYSFRHVVGETILSKLEHDFELFERPASFNLYREHRNGFGKTGKEEDGFILVKFSSKMKARLAVIYLRTKFPAHIDIELETDYRERRPVSSELSNASPVKWRNYAPSPSTSHPWLKRKAEPGEIHDSNPPLLRVSSMSGHLPAKPDVCPALKEDDSRFHKSFKRNQDKLHSERRQKRGSSSAPVFHEKHLEARDARRGRLWRDSCCCVERRL